MVCKRRKETSKMSQLKKKDAENDKANKVISRYRLPLIGSSGNRSTARPALSTPKHPLQAETRKCGRPPISSAALTDSMAPWDGSSHSKSSFTSFQTPISPFSAAHTMPITTQEPHPPPLPSQIKNTQPENGQSARVKHKPLPPRYPTRPPRLPPLREVTNLSFSLSFTFSFFELPVHQSARSRAERLRDLTVLLKEFQY